MRMGVGNGGWIAVDGIGLPGPLYLRMARRDDRFRAVELYIDAQAGPAAIEVRDLRDLPLAEIESVANSAADALDQRLAYPAPDLSTFASYFASTISLSLGIERGNWVAFAFASQHVAAHGATTGVSIRAQRKLATGSDAQAALAADPSLQRVQVVGKSKDAWDVRQSDKDFRLESGPTSGLTDDFMRDLARAYLAAIERGERPNRAICDQLKGDQQHDAYPLRTVQRWVYDARKRGFLPPGVKGRVG